MCGQTMTFAAFKNDFVEAESHLLVQGDVLSFKSPEKDGVVLILQDGFIKSDQQAFKGEVQKGKFHYLQAPFALTLSNDQDTPLPLLFITIKAKTHIGAGKATLAGVPRHFHFFENDKIEAYRVHFRPGDTSGWHHHVRRGLAVVLDDGKMAMQELGAKPEQHDFRAGLLFWHPENLNHYLENVGKDEIQIIDMEWK